MAPLTSLMMVPELVMVPSLMMVPELVMVPDVISNIIPESTVNVSPEFTESISVIWHVFGEIQAPPIASQEVWSEIVPPAANAS